MLLHKLVNGDTLSTDNYVILLPMITARITSISRIFLPYDPGYYLELSSQLHLVTERRDKQKTVFLDTTRFLV